MAHRREHRVVFLGLHLEDVRAATLPGRADQRDRARVVVPQRRQHHFAPAVEFGERRFGAAFFRSCDRVAGHEAGKRALELAPRQFHDVLFRAPCVGHDRPYAEERRDRAHDRLHLPDRHGEQHQIGVGQRRRIERAGVVDDLQIERSADVLRAATDTDHAAHCARPFQRERERAADQADSHDHQLLDARHHSSSAILSALRNFSFSLGVPTVTRRWSGMS